MKFVSYAQNLEDVMLWRALRHVKNGFYVDVGANDPINESVTAAFYERGWMGINIEPIAKWHKLLMSERQRDINLQMIAGNEKSQVEIYEVEDTGLSTVVKEVALSHQSEGRKVSAYPVWSDLLDEILDEYAHKDIHFLKIDVEGAEKTVLEGISFAKHRPWIILVEATKPNSQEQNHADWEPLITQRGYSFVYFDGLNRFYIADEHSELKKEFLCPPNFFDNYLKHSEEWAMGAVLRLENHNHALEKEVKHLKEKIDGICKTKTFRICCFVAKIKAFLFGDRHLNR